VKLAGTGGDFELCERERHHVDGDVGAAEMAIEHPRRVRSDCMRRCIWGRGRFVARYTYWLCLVIIVGSEVAAAGIYCQLLVSQHSIVALDCGLFPRARLHEHAEYKNFGIDRVLVSR